VISTSKFLLKRVQGSPVSDQDILGDLRRAAKLAGTEVLSQRLYAEFGTIDPTTARRRFGTWNEALAIAGLQIANEFNIPDGRLFENILIAVGTRITARPPHRTVRAEFPHTAPTLGV
jgi:hypothetical protein